MWEDLYRFIKRMPGAPAILILMGCASLTFVFWNSLPDSVKAKILNKMSVDIFKIDENSAINENSKHIEIPDISRAIRVTKALKVSDFVVTRGKVQDDSPKGCEGFFKVSIPPNTEVVCNLGEVLCNRVVKPNFFLTCRMAAGYGTNTIELKGLGVVFLLSPHENRYMIYNSEENLSSWRQLPVSKHNSPWKTMGMHQVGRHVDVYLNSKHIDSLDIWNSPTAGMVGVMFKADPKIGGDAGFQRLAIYEFERK